MDSTKEIKTEQRELKFRVWNGSEMVYDVTVGKFGVFYVNPSNNGLDEKGSASLAPFTTKYHTPVMQFTGLRDKNGKEIWEGDVLEIKFGYDHLSDLKYSYGRSPVSFEPSECGWCVKDDMDRLNRLSGFHLPEFEVVGNIYEQTTNDLKI